MSRFFSEDRGWLLLICGYFLFHALYRAMMGGALGLDEAQMILESQSLRWGYAQQPPLYAWLQYFVASIFGNSILSLALLKNALLTVTYLMAYRLFRTQAKPEIAGLCALGLLLVPQIAWESQRALTHSVLVTALSVTTIAVFWQMIRRPGRLADYALLGLLIGFGALSKYNYLLVPVSALIAAASLPEGRRFLRRRSLLLTGILAVAIPAKPLLWMLQHKDTAFASVKKFHIKEDPGVFSGLSAFSGAFGGFLAISIAVTLLFYWLFAEKDGGSEQDEQSGPSSSLFSRFLLRYFLVSLLILLLFVLFSGTTRVKDRWLQPQFSLLAPFLIYWLLPRIKVEGKQRLAQLYGLIAIAIAIALPFHNFYGTALRATPFERLAQQLEADFSEKPGIIWGNNTWMAGNIKYVRPDWPIYDPLWLGQKRRPPSSSYIAIARGSDPQKLVADLQKAGIAAARINPATNAVMSFPYRFSSKKFTVVRTVVGVDATNVAPQQPQQ